jgi:hypothetical protein
MRQHKKIWLGSLTLLGASTVASAQDAVPQLTRVNEDRVAIELDGRLDEAIWQQIPVMDGGMRVITPDTLVDASLRTETRVF